MKGKSGEAVERTVHTDHNRVSSCAPPGLFSHPEQQNSHKVFGSGDGAFTSQIT